MGVQDAKDLIVYRKAYDLAMQIFHISQKFPIEERYGLTDQVRRASRSVCQNLREAWAKRRYAANFVSKLTDCDGENSEVETVLDFARDCGYISAEEYQRLNAQNREIGRMLGAMIRRPEPFLLRKNDVTS